jgi:hypothetical protein
MDCIFKLRSQVRKLAYGMTDLSRKLPVNGGETTDSGLDETEGEKPHGTK